MIDDIKYTSVRIYRKEGAFDLIKGSGLLFEDNGVFYVLTAFHCMQCKDADGSLITLDTSKTEIVMLVNKKQINITINDVIEYNEEKDWILLAVEKPELDEEHIQKIKFTNQININIECDSYPYLSIMKGYPRYTPLRSLNDMGDFHLIDNASSGRYTADTVMKGGSGSGILRKNEADILCFGLMKETLTDGSLNDIASVDLSEISQILSAEAKKRMTRLEVNQMILDDRNDALNEIKQQILNKQADGTLADFMTHLVYEDIPNLLNHYSLDTAWEILQLVIENLPAESDLAAECDYLCAEYYNIKGETDKAREYYNKAFLLCNTEPKYIEHQIKLYQHYEDQASADELLAQLPENNECRLANAIISSRDVREAFNNAPIEITSLPTFRCRILELSEAKQIDIAWLFEDYVPIIPQNLTVQNLREWFFLLSYYRFILRDYIVLNRENSQIPNLETIKEAFSVTKRFFTLAAGTPLEHGIPILRSLYCYWGYILDGSLNWIEEFDKIEFSKAGAQAQFCILLQSSLYSMQHRYVEAYLCISSKHLAYDSSVLHYIIHLSVISGDVSFLKSYLAEHTSEEIVITDYMDNSLAGLLNIMTPEDFKSFVSGLQFLNQNAKQILLDYAQTLNGGSVDVTGYPIVAEGAIGNLASFAARTMASNGKYDAALAYLQPLLRTGQSIVVDATYRDLLSRDRSKADEYYKELHRNRIEGGVVLLNDLTMEYNFSISMSDFANALEVIELMLQEQPDNEMYFSAKVDLLGKVHPQKLPSVYKDAQNWQYESVQSVTTVYSAFAQNGYIQEAIDILYYNCLRLQDEELLSFFDTECVMGAISSIVNQSSEVIEDGSHVIIEHEDGSRDPMKVKAQTILGQALLGHKKDDKIVVSMPDGEKAVVVISILNKYSYLHAMHFKEIFRNGGNGIFKPIHIDTSHPETILQQLNDALGRDTTVDKKKAMIEGYREGTVPLLKMVSDDDTIGDYYNFLFSKFKVKLIPYLTDKERKEALLIDSHKYLLDFTSLLLFFEFSLLHPEVEFKHKFTISPFLAELVKAYRKNARVLASFPLYEAIQQGHIHHFSDNISEDIDLRLDALLSWIQVHCVVVQDTAVLRVSDPAQTPTSQLFVNTYIGLIDENKDSNVLISDDFNIERMVKAPLPSISSETYIYTHMGAEVGMQYSIFLCENNCLGSNVPSDYVVDQYSLFENGKDSKLMNILDPDHLSSDVATMLRACHGIINKAQNKDIASSTTRTLLVNIFRFANEEFISSQAWKGIYFIQQQSEVGRKYICPVLDEICSKVTHNSQ